MTAEQITALWQGLAVFLFGCVLILGVAWLSGPTPPDCSPDCNHCPAWRREQQAKAKQLRMYAYCPVCWKRHPPSEPHK